MAVKNGKQMSSTKRNQTAIVQTTLLSLHFAVNFEHYSYCTATAIMQVSNSSKSSNFKLISSNFKLYFNNFTILCHYYKSKQSLEQ